MPAPASDSLIDRVDPLDQPRGTIPRREALRPGNGFRVAHTLVRNSRGELLLQRIAANRERSPLRWGSSAAGYLHAGETYAQAAQRRTAEEIAVTAPLTELGVIRMPDHGANKFIGVFLAEADTADILDHAQVEELRFWSADDIRTELSENPDAFSETFAYVFGLYLTAEADPGIEALAE